MREKPMEKRENGVRVEHLTGSAVAETAAGEAFGSVTVRSSQKNQMR